MSSGQRREACGFCGEIEGTGPNCMNCAEVAWAPRDNAFLARSRSSLEQPELLTALKDLVAGLDATYWSSWQTTARFDPALKAARAAIAKAEGHQP